MICHGRVDIGRFRSSGRRHILDSVRDTFSHTFEMTDFLTNTEGRHSHLVSCAQQNLRGEDLPSREDKKSFVHAWSSGSRLSRPWRTLNTKCYEVSFASGDTYMVRRSVWLIIVQ